MVTHVNSDAASVAQLPADDGNDIVSVELDTSMLKALSLVGSIVDVKIDAQMAKVLECLGW